MQRAVETVRRALRAAWLPCKSEKQHTAPRIGKPQNASVAQLAGQLIRNQRVGGSIPPGGFRRGVKQTTYDVRGVYMYPKRRCCRHKSDVELGRNTGRRHGKQAEAAGVNPAAGIKKRFNADIIQRQYTGFPSQKCGFDSHYPLSGQRSQYPSWFRIMWRRKRRTRPKAPLAKKMGVKDLMPELL